jgi:fructokinase
MHYVIALDIGGTKIEGALFDSRYRQIKKLRVPSPTTAPRAKVLATITGLIDTLKIRKIRGIGISFPSCVLAGGRIPTVTKILCLRNFKLQDYLKRKYRCRVVVANDADCFALGEHRMGAARGAHSSFGLIWGTGVGGGFIINDAICTGKRISAGEVGHNVVNPHGPKNEVGMQGDIESYAGGRCVVRNYILAGGKLKNPTTRTIYFSHEPIAQRVMDDAIDKLSLLCSHIVHTLCPDVIVLGGGLSNLPAYARLNALTKKYTWKNMRPYVKIVKNKLGDSAGIYGAAVLVM